MDQRDTFKEKEHWAKVIADERYLLQQAEERRTKPGVRLDGVNHSVFLHALALLIALYSAGEDLAVVRANACTALDAFVTYAETPHRRDALSIVRLDTYIDVLWLISFGILFDLDQPLVTRLVTAIDDRGVDALYERLIAFYGLPCVPCETLPYPRPYEFLYRALDAEGAEQEALIARFLQTYYRGMRHAYWYDLHLHPNPIFFGYWCFELAACVKALEISDESFANHVYYPRDLVREET